MWGVTKVGRTRNAAVLAGGAVVLAVAGCGGGKDFENKPRPAVPIQLTGAITPQGVSVEPSKVGAGPAVLRISNLTSESHTITIEGPSSREQVGPINPQDVGQIQENLKPGTYEVRAGSARAAPKSIRPAKLTVGPARPSSSNSVLLP
jgi:hypothetical protein